MNRRNFIGNMGFFLVGALVSPTEIITPPAVEEKKLYVWECMYFTGSYEYDFTEPQKVEKPARVISINKPLPKIILPVRRNYQARRA